MEYKTLRQITGLNGSQEAKIRAEKLRAAEISFWEYCKLINPKFFKDDRPHLKIIADTLQALYEGRIRKAVNSAAWEIYPDADCGNIVCKQLLLNLPPRHGKSYILTLFTQWIFGKNKENRIITASYNDTLASRFSGAVRDGIDATKIDESLTIFSDIFPGIRIKGGDGAKQLWALEGSHFSYLGTSFGGTITGIGCSIGIIDDPIRNADEAFNETALEKQWIWYTDTFLSRIEERGFQIINMTRWSTKDLCGRLLESEDAPEWYELKMKACPDEENGVMLCPALLSYKSYAKKKRLTSPVIFEANYQQEPVDVQGALYSGFNTYIAVDTDKFERHIAYIDTADEGADYLCAVIGGVIGRYGYVTDVYYTDAAMEVTEPETARKLADAKTREAIIESNNGGRGFARNVGRLLKGLGARRCNITWFHQSKNKRTRIIVNSVNVMEQVVMPEGWELRWPEFAKALKGYQRKGKNKHDDAPDALTGFVEVINGDVKGIKRARIYDIRQLGL